MQAATDTLPPLPSACLKYTADYGLRPIFEASVPAFLRTLPPLGSAEANLVLCSHGGGGHFVQGVRGDR
jgi:hypothetical protein